MDRMIRPQRSLTGAARRTALAPIDDLAVSAVTIDQTGQVVSSAPVTAPIATIALGHRVTLGLALIPALSFLMGSPPGLGYDDERPQHAVTMPEYSLGAFEVTQAQWEAVMGELPLCRFPGPRRPVDNGATSSASEWQRTPPGPSHGE